MAVRPTLQLGDPRLRTSCAAVPDAYDIETLAGDLADTLADWVRRTGYGRGIAAPQVGAAVRVLYLNVDRPWLLVNPVITTRAETTWEPRDTCLSFAVEFFCGVRRATWVEVAYRSMDGDRHTFRADGELGELLQHEIDHLDGILAVDRMTDATTLCMRSEFEHRYRDESPYRQ